MLMSVAYDTKTNTPENSKLKAERARLGISAQRALEVGTLALMEGTVPLQGAVSTPAPNVGAPSMSDKMSERMQGMMEMKMMMQMLNPPPPPNNSLDLIQIMAALGQVQQTGLSQTLSAFHEGREVGKEMVDHELTPEECIMGIADRHFDAQAMQQSGVAGGAIPVDSGVPGFQNVPGQSDGRPPGIHVSPKDKVDSVNAE